MHPLVPLAPEHIFFLCLFFFFFFFGKALEYCEAHAASARASSREAWDDDAYARSVRGDALFELVAFASKWGCDGLARVLAKRVLHATMEAYDTVGALRRAFGVHGEFTEDDEAEAAALAPALVRDVREAAFHWHRQYFLCLQQITFAKSRREQTVGATRGDERDAQLAVTRVAANEWFYAAFLARLRGLRATSATSPKSPTSVTVTGVAAELLAVRPSVWRMMHEHLRAMRPDDLAAGISRDARWERNLTRKAEMGLCHRCGVPTATGAQLVAHGYYDSATHQADLANLLPQFRYLADGEQGLLRFENARGGFLPDRCEHEGKPWTLGSW